MKDQFSVNFDSLANSLTPDNVIRLSDVQHRIEKVAYDTVRFMDNDTEQLWKIQETPDGEAVLVALYNDKGSLVSESDSESDWEAIPDKKAMNIFYKGEPIVALSSEQLGVPENEFSVARRWLPKKLASDEDIQKELLSLLAPQNRKLIASRFPELTKVAQYAEDGISTEEVEDLFSDVGAETEQDSMGYSEWNLDDKESDDMEDHSLFLDEVDMEEPDFSGLAEDVKRLHQEGKLSDVEAEALLERIKAEM